MTTIPQVEKTVLDNGLKIITESISVMRSVAVGIIVGAGGRDEKDTVNRLFKFDPRSARLG